MTRWVFVPLFATQGTPFCGALTMNATLESQCLNDDTFLRSASRRITCSVFVPPMVKTNKGHIVELASMSSFISVGSFSDYSAGKAALVSFTESESSATS